MKRRICGAALSAALCLTLLPVHALALDVSPRPDPGTTQGQPFEHNPNTAGSDSFRIPGLVTLRDGTLLATADARWNTTYDGGGLDTIVSRSTDNGATWSYSFANYLGDNGNEYSGSGSTCFIDPSVAVVYDEDTGSETIYLLADLYPYGVALNGQNNLWPAKESGFDAQDRLLLSTDTYGSETGGNNATYTYEYYLDQSSGTIKSIAGDTEVEGLSVDGHFNVTGTYNGGEVNSNLFFSDSPFKVQRTSYLYLVTSTDGGESWSDPSLIPLKSASERAYLVAPSRGLVTSRGEIVFPCYSYDNTGGSQPQYLSFIYSTDGVSWARSEDDPVSTPSNWNSESVAVELSDGRLRFFARNNYTSCLSYFDYIPGSNGLSGGSWSGQTRTNVVTNSNCQISAIKYSHTSEGKDVLLISCPTGPNESGSNQSSGSQRLNGKIFAARVNDDADMTLEWVDEAKIDVSGAVNDGVPFMYSALTEITRPAGGCQPGDIAILYEMNEAGWGFGPGKYYEMHFQTHSLSGIDFDPMFVKQPAYSGPDLSTGSGATVTLDVEVDLTEGVTYQWYCETNGEGPVALDGATEPSYTVDIDALGVGSHYLFCKITKGSYTMDSDQVPITIVSTPETFTITLDPAGGAVSPEALNTDETGKLGTLPTPTRDGYTFNGWYTQSTGGDRVTGETVFDANATIYAQWTENSSGNPGGSGGSGGSSGSSSSNGVSGSGDNVSISTSGSSISNSQMEQAVKKADKGSQITLKADSTAVSLPSGGLTEAASNSNGITVTLRHGTITFDTRTIEGLVGGLPSTDNINVAINSKTSSQDQEILDLLKSDAAVFDVAISAGGQDVHSLKGQLTLTFTVPSLAKIDNPHILHILADNSREYYAPDRVEGNKLTVKGIQNLSVFAVIPGSLVPTEPEKPAEPEQPEPLPFQDVPADAYYYDAVQWAVKEGITSGTSDTTFSPDMSCTRAQMVMFLWRAAGSPATDYAVNFVDVDPNAYYSGAVRWAAENGITGGTSDTTFSPDAVVTRSQTVVLLYRAASSPAASGSGAFVDVADGAYYADAVQWAVKEGITSGTSATAFSPDMNCTRAQIVTFLFRNAH